MNYIKTVRKIKDKKLIIDIPDDFESEEVEVIVLPLYHYKTEDEDLMKVSEPSFREWDNDADEIYNSL